MWEFIKSVGKFIKWTISSFSTLARLFNVGAEVVNLRSAMLLNTINIKNKHPLETLTEHEDLSKLARDTAIYVSGIRQLNPTYPVEVLTKQHDALIQFIDNLDRYPLKDDYTLDVYMLIKNIGEDENVRRKKIVEDAIARHKAIEEPRDE